MLTYLLYAPLPRTATSLKIALVIEIFFCQGKALLASGQRNSKLRGINPRFLLAARQRASKPCALLSLRSVGSEFRIFLFAISSLILLRSLLVASARHREFTLFALALIATLLFPLTKKSRAHLTLGSAFWQRRLSLNTYCITNPSSS